jgi:hypothetical protein
MFWDMKGKRVQCDPSNGQPAPAVARAFARERTNKDSGSAWSPTGVDRNPIFPVVETCACRKCCAAEPLGGANRCRPEGV